MKIKKRLDAYMDMVCPKCGNKRIRRYIGFDGEIDICEICEWCVNTSAYEKIEEKKK